MGRSKVMVVDDSDLILNMTKDTLEEAGFDVITRNNPLGTTAAINNEKPDCILIDVSMPALSGGEIVKLARKNINENLRILFYSAKVESELIQLVNDCGADGYIQKGEDKSLLVKRVRETINN